MTEQEEKEFVYHNDVISSFNTKLFSNIFTDDNVTSLKKSIKIGEVKYYGYYLEKNKEVYFATDAHVKQLPFKVIEYSERDFKTEVYKMITKIQSIVIPADKRMSFRHLVDTTPNFNHSNPLHFKLYKIVSLAGYIDRLNVRVSTEAGFGKDSTISIIGGLVNSTANIYGATFAKLEYLLKNKFLVMNEMGNLKSDDKANMQEFLLAIGAYFNTYNKRSRKTSNTQEQYDISKTSLMIMYNLPEYYVSRGQEYFDMMFTKAVANRFIPFLFEGRLTTKFDKVIDPVYLSDKYDSTLKDTIATINYFKNNNVTEIKYVMPKEVKFSDELMRYDRSFKVISKYISEYSLNQEEFDLLTKELYKCYLNYGKHTSKNVELGDIK
jgi:hypothetical protein